MSFKDQQYGRWKSGKTMCLIQFLPGRSNERLMTPATELLSMICMAGFFSETAWDSSEPADMLMFRMYQGLNAQPYARSEVR